jgi:hypothetical protein
MIVGLSWVSGGKGGRTGHKIVAAYGKGAHVTGLSRGWGGALFLDSIAAP